MSEESERKSEIAATVFSVTLGIVVLLMAGWLVSRGSDPVDERQANSGAPEVIDGAAEEDAAEASRRAALALEKRAVEGELDETREELEAARTDLAEQTSRLSRLEGEYKTAIGDREAGRDRLAQEVDRLEREAVDRAARLTGLEENAEELKGELARLREQSQEAEAKAAELAGRLQKDLDAARDEAAKSQTERERALARMETLEGQLSELESARKSLEEENAGLVQTVSELKSKSSIDEKERRAAQEAAQTKIDLLGREKAALGEEVEKLRAELAEAKKAMAAAATSAGEEAAMREKEKAKLQARVKALESELESNTRKMASAEKSAEANIQALTDEKKSLAEMVKGLRQEVESSSQELAESRRWKEKNRRLEADLAAATSRIDELTGEVTVLKSGAILAAAAEIPELDFPFLVEDPKNLDGRMLPLFADLRKVPDDPKARQRSYRELERAGGGKRVATVNFDSGSATVAAPDRKTLGALLTGAAENTRFLVVGYASTDGNPESNAVLSSERASAVAQIIAGDGPDQRKKVQAVYFGQTSRFSVEEPSPNRIVEVWQID